jgi:signal peptidase I
MMSLEHEKKMRRAHITREVIEVILLVVVISVAIKLSIDTRFVEGDSMEPSLPPSQLVMVNKLAYLFGSPQRGDVIVLYFPLDTTKQFIKRIIGVPGDTIDLSPTEIKVNGHPIAEPYVTKEINSQVGSVTLGPDQYFVMGDHREVSCDSRSWGPLPKSDIIGKVTLIYWPLNKIHGVNTYESTFSGIPDEKPTKPSSNIPFGNDCAA